MIVSVVCPSCVTSYDLDTRLYNLETEDTPQNRIKYNIQPAYISNISDKLLICECCFEKHK